MERTRDSRPEEDGQMGLLKETVTLRDRAARKERERERLRELLNRGKKKRRRISSDKHVVSPRNGCNVDPANDCLRGGTTSFSHCHGSVPQLKRSGLSPAIVICASVPRQPRSVGKRRKGKSWGQIGFNAKVQLPSAPVLVEKSSPSLVQNDIEVEIAEVLYGLKKQVSPSDEPVVYALEKIPAESENQSTTVQDCSVIKASKDQSVDMSQAELSIDITSEPLNGDLEIHNQDKAVLKQEISTGEEGPLLCSKSLTNCTKLAKKEVVSSSVVEAKSKHQSKFAIDLMEPPPMESSPDGDGVARLTLDPQIVSKDAKVKSLPEKATVGSFLKEEVVDEKQLPSHLPQKMVIKVESHDLDQGSPDHTGNELKQPFHKQQKPYLNTSIASAPISSSLLPLGLTGLSSCPHEGTYIESRGRNHGYFASMKPPDFRLIQPRPKRCATHHYIAQNIYRHQQALAERLFSAEVPQDLLSYFAKPNNDNDLLSSERRISGNLPQGRILGGNLNFVKDRAQSIEFYSQTNQQENNLRPASTVQNTYKHASYQIPMPFQTGHMMAGHFIFHPNQNRTMMANQLGLSLSAPSTSNMRFNHPNGAPFLPVLPRNVCNDPSSNGKKMQSSSGGKNTHPMPFLDGQLHPSQIFFPVQIQQQPTLPFTTRAISSASDIRTSNSQRNVTGRSLFPLHSPNIASMPSAGFGGGQWKYAEKHYTESGEKSDSTSSFSFASFNPSPPTNAGGPSLKFPLARNSVVAQSFLDNTNLGSQILRASNGAQHTNSERVQNINGGESMQPDGERKLAMGKFPSFIGQSSFISTSCSTVSPAPMGAMVFDTSVTTPNYKLSLAMQNALSARIHLNNSNPLGASQNKPVLLQNQQQQMLQTMAAQLKVAPSVNNQHSPSVAAKVSDGLSIFSGNLFDRSRSSHSLQQRTSDIKQDSEGFPASGTPLCNSSLYNPHQQKLAIPSSHIQI